MQQLKKLFEDDFNMLSQMSIKEYTLYRGWHQIHNKEWSRDEKQRMWEVKNSIWMPESPDDYLNIDPVVICADNKNYLTTWSILRHFTHAAHWNSNPGRSIRFIVLDRITKTYIGIISLGSDFMSLTPRDNHIGWSSKDRQQGKLRYTAMGSSISPTQPFGYNFVGGKLIALLVCSDVVVNEWNKRYDKDKLVGITTTSLYGGFSQYTRLKYWRKCGTSEGKILLEPSDHVYQEARQKMRELYPEEVSKIDGSSHPKNRMLSFIYKRVGVRPPQNNAPRGTYWCKLYTKTNEFLRNESKDYGEKLFDNSIQSLTELWKEKYAGKRVKSLLENNKYNLDKLFYDDMIKLSWEEARQKYLQKDKEDEI